MPPEWQLGRSVHMIMIFPTDPPDAIKQLLRLLRFDNFRTALLESVESDSCRREAICHQSDIRIRTVPLDAIKQLLRFFRFDNFRDALLESVELDSCRRVLCHAHSKTSLGSVYLSESRAHDRYIL